MEDFFTPGTLLTLGGSTAAVVVIVNAFQGAFNTLLPGWVILLLSVAVAGVAFWIAYQPRDSKLRNQRPFVLALLVLLNGCLIYTSAFGLQSTVIAQRGASQGMIPITETDVGVRTAWTL